jgi:hypothetical protein
MEYTDPYTSNKPHPSTLPLINSAYFAIACPQMRTCGFKGHAEHCSSGLAACPLDSLTSGHIEYLHLGFVITNLKSERVKEQLPIWTFY